MAAVSEAIVREYFELHGFLVCQQHKHSIVGRRAQEDIDFLIMNPGATSGVASLPEVLTAKDLPLLGRAAVVVKGWHTEVFGESLLSHAPEIFRFLEPQTMKQAARFFGPDAPFAKLLVVPALPRPGPAYEQALKFLRSRGVDAVIPFHTVLRGLIDSVKVNHNYQKSDLLQTIRILKNYEFFRETQLELFPTKRKNAAAQGEK